MPSMLAIVTTAPRDPSTRGWSNMRAMACLAVRNVPYRLTPTTRFHSWVSTMWTAPPPATPAAFTRPSTRPKARAVSSTRCMTEASSVTSTAVKAHVALPDATPGASPPDTRSAPMTLAPSSSRRAAVACPIPDDAPVTITFLPAKPRIWPPRRLHPGNGLSAGGLDDRTLHRAVRLVLRDPRPPAVGPRQRAHGVQERARPGGGGRALRVGRILDRRAPLPVGVLPLLEPRGPLRRR